MPSGGWPPQAEGFRKHSMDKFVITGGTALQGEVAANGSKNSALPALAAALLTEEPVTLHRIPRVRDIRTMQRLLVDIGTAVEVTNETVRLETPQIVSPEAPYELVKTMRASSLVLGPLVARCGRARVSLPGGCAIGARPINLHIFGLEQLGARIEQAHGYIEALAPEGLHGGTIYFDRITVTGTEDLMMRSEEHTSELQSLRHLVCRLLLEKKKKKKTRKTTTKTTNKKKNQTQPKTNKQRRTLLHRTKAKSATIQRTNQHTHMT